MLLSLPNALGDAATNMALDAALAAALPPNLAVFRHYGWIEPAFTFGYAQRFEEVEHTIHGLEPRLRGVTLCRRLTGGGIVDHRDDWTYALIAHRSLAAAREPAPEIYKKVHQAVVAALSLAGCSTHLAPCPQSCGDAKQTTVPTTSGPSQCFQEPVAHDVVRANGRKVAGAAMRRNRQALLIQGSLNLGALPATFDPLRFQDDFLTHLARLPGLHRGESEDIRGLFVAERIETERKRFASPEWQHKR